MQLEVNGALCVFTAREGDGPFGGNLGRHVHDDPDAVGKRRRALSERLGAPVVWMDQTHSARIALVNEEDSADIPRLAADEWGPLDVDGVITDAPGAAVMTADCIPLLLISGDGALVAAVHVGRAGLEQRIHANAIREMARIGADPSTTVALIGPAVCGRCYEVPAEMQSAVAATHPAARTTTRWGTPGLDITAALAEDLHALGVEDVRSTGICTMEDERYNSYRRDPRCGRQAGVVVPSGHWRLAGDAAADDPSPWHNV